VLPFTNLSSEKEQEYLCDGLAERIMMVSPNPIIFL